ncbi:hypothetical protein N8E89_15130 [Phyllobacterium sp. A18/5-2]|uniref:hypothetical protein n=1 Tax=Phyllobacterium sp. A18/5-2 TaxID=2978392 RepID=UPI0021C60BD9|nr:hypothetical protein [Phyllobacterium sp. A18/5-2]UXN63831.1 hypothetical protein N8E89_15130 [Phyllobacterium sp. A18/5-2]
MRRLLLISCAMAATTPALAQTIDAKGAKELAETLSKYVGKTAIEKKIIDVRPEGDGYRVTFSSGKLLRIAAKTGILQG